MEISYSLHKTGNKNMHTLKFKRECHWNHNGKRKPDRNDHFQTNHLTNFVGQVFVQISNNDAGNLPFCI